MHEKRKHALLSASGAYRWLNCTPSALLEDKAEKNDTDFSREGTLAHEYAEIQLQKFLGAERPEILREREKQIKESDFYTPSFAESVQEYVSYILNLMSKAKSADPFAYCLTEHRVEFDKCVPGGFGTADSVIIAGRTAYITDLKFGKGVKVSAFDNPQLKLYAFGVYQQFWQFVDLDKFILTIHQPRLEHVESFEITLSELLKWVTEVVIPKATQAINGEGELKLGEWCQFCAVKQNCKLIQSHYSDFEDLSSKSVEGLQTDELDSVIKKVLCTGDFIKKWISFIQELALIKALNGEKIEGYKIVPGRSIRQFTDKSAVAKRLELAGYGLEEIYDFDLKGITRLEKIVGAAEFKKCFSDLIHKPEGKPVLVPVSDPREEISEINEFTVLKEN